MKVGIMQPYFFPYLGYWQLISAVDKFVIYDDVNYINRGWINRNNILVNNNAKLITLSLKKASQNKLINEIDINCNSENRPTILRTLEMAYNKAPYFETVYPIIEKIIKNEEVNLALYLKHSIEIICDYLEVETQIYMSSSLKKDNTLKGEDKIIAICKALNANTYINSIGGIHLYNKANFNKEKINLYFLNSNAMRYKQFDEKLFVNNLSIIDILMFNSREEISRILKEFELLEDEGRIN